MKKVLIPLLIIIIVIAAIWLFMKNENSALNIQVETNQDLIENEETNNESVAEVNLSENSLETLMEKSVLENEEQERLFKNLVGDYYSLFVETFQLITEKEDLDGFGAKVYSGNVRGLFTIMEAIIMVTPESEFWAAIIDEDKVVCFTNSKDSFEKLPNTIEKWRERFKEKEIIFK